MSHGNDEITTELAARILRRVARIRKTTSRMRPVLAASTNLTFDLDAILMYLTDIENLVHFNDPYGDPEATMTRSTLDPPIVPPTPLPASFQGIVEDTP